MLRCYVWMLTALCGGVMCEKMEAGVLREDFSTNPAASGWNTYGNTNLFQWNGAQGTLNVTWDSSTSNSYFYHSLGTVLDRNDDFSLEFDLRLLDIATTTKPGPFEIAVGFINFADATRTNYWRGSGVDAVHGPRSIVEFDYFPAGYYPAFNYYSKPTISPSVVSSNNNEFLAQFAELELTNGLPFHIKLDYAASNATLRTTLTCNGAAVGPVPDLALDTNFTDFRVDTVAISSYSDTGDDYDSVLAHAVMDNLVVTTPEPPVTEVTGAITNGGWQVQFTSRTNWIYALERTTDAKVWTPLPATAPGNGGILFLQDPTPPAGAAWYRVRAQKP